MTERTEEGSQHLPCEYQTMRVGDFQTIESTADESIFKRIVNGFKDSRTMNFFRQFVSYR